MVKLWEKQEDGKSFAEFTSTGAWLFAGIGLGGTALLLVLAGLIRG